LQKIIDRSEIQNVAFLRTKGVILPEKKYLENALAIENQVKVAFPPVLPVKDKTWDLPNLIHEQDFIVYSLSLPLRAVDLLWIENIPTNQPSWLMVPCDDSVNWSDEKNALEAQLPKRWTNRILKWNGTQVEMTKVLAPIKRLLDQPINGIITRDHKPGRLICRYIFNPKKINSS
jgi:hypothetical protein